MEVTASILHDSPCPPFPRAGGCSTARSRYPSTPGKGVTERSNSSPKAYVEQLAVFRVSERLIRCVVSHRYRGFNGSMMEVPHKSGQRSYVVSGIITQVGSAQVAQRNSDNLSRTLHHRKCTTVPALDD